MLLGIIWGLAAAWFLSVFGVDHGFVNVVMSFSPPILITTDHYYLVAAIIGAIAGFKNDWDRDLI